MTTFRIRAGERREIISGPGGVGTELVFTAETTDGAEPTGLVEETRHAMYGEAVNEHPLMRENTFRLGRAAHSRTRTRFRLAVTPDQDVTVRITRGYTSPARILLIVAVAIIVIFGLLGAYAVLA